MGLLLRTASADDDIFCLAFSPQSPALLAAGLASGAVAVWDAQAALAAGLAGAGGAACWFDRVALPANRSRLCAAGSGFAPAWNREHQVDFMAARS